MNELSYALSPEKSSGLSVPTEREKPRPCGFVDADQPDVGDAFVDGFSVVNDPDRVRYRLGFMPDSYGAYPNVSCIEYLDFMRGPTDCLARTGLARFGGSPTLPTWSTCWTNP